MGGLTPLVQSRPAGGGGAFACSDLNACSLAALGTKDHDLLAGLLDDDHTQYGFLSGRSGGQLYKGGSGASEHLTLQSTAHATRGYLRAQDDLQLLSNLLRDSGGNNRLQLATASPHHKLTGDAIITERLQLQSAAALAAGTSLKIAPTSVPGGGTSVTGINYAPSGLSGLNGLTMMSLGPSNCGILSGRSAKGLNCVSAVSLASGASGGYVYGLYYRAMVALGGDGAVCNRVIAIYAQTGQLRFTGTIAQMKGLWVAQPYVFSGTYSVTEYVGAQIDNPARSTFADVTLLKLGDITQNSGYSRIIEAGPATPYLRLRGGSAPGAGLSNLDLNLGGTLKAVSEGVADSGGAGFKVLRVPN